MSFITPPFRKPDICAISGVGTTSWFLEPISTYAYQSQKNEDFYDGVRTAVRTLNSSAVTYLRSVASNFISGSQSWPRDKKDRRMWWSMRKDRDLFGTYN